MFRSVDTLRSLSELRRREKQRERERDANWRERERLAMVWERRRRSWSALTRAGTRRKIVCAQGFQGVHPRVGPAPDTTLTPPFYGVVKYLSSSLSLSLSCFLSLFLLLSCFPLADSVPSSLPFALSSASSPLPSSLPTEGALKGGVLAFTLRHALFRFGAWHKRKKRIVLHPFHLRTFLIIILIFCLLILVTDFLLFLNFLLSET